MKLLNRSKILIVIACMLISGVFVYGCEDFLQKPPLGSLDENTLSNKNGVEGALIAAYRALSWNTGVGGAWGNASASNWVWGSVLSDDAHKGSEATDQPNITDLELYNWTTGQADSYLNDKWRGMYEGVNRSNAAINLLDKVLNESPGQISEADENSIRGEAIFLRAHFHFELWKMWENIAYYTEEDDTFTKSNQGVNVIDNILSDLDTAIGLLPDTPRNGEPGRVTSWVAKAYKGKVQIFNQDYAGALNTLREVRNSGPYALEEEYHHVWTGLSQYYNGPETILAFQASSNDGNTSGNNANYGTRLNFPHSGSPFGCCGFHQATQNLANFFMVDENGHPTALEIPDRAFDATAPWNDRDEEFDATANDIPVDPRIDWTMGRDGVPFKDWGLHEPGWIRQEAFGGPYSAKKNIHESASDAQHTAGGWVNTQLNSVRIHILRYADMLLYLAEAEVEAGSLENARQIVNEIRMRAGVGAQGPGTSVDDISVPIDDPSITWADYEIGLYNEPWTDQDLARWAVRVERRLELAMEGHRFFDLKRYGFNTASSTINNYVDVEQGRRSWMSAAAEFTERYMRFPIPSVQIELSQEGGESTLVQNDGW